MIKLILVNQQNLGEIIYYFRMDVKDLFSVNIFVNDFFLFYKCINDSIQNPDKSKDTEDSKQDLRSRGLCLVPVSSTFPVTHETTVDFWTPTFGGTFR